MFNKWQYDDIYYALDKKPYDLQKDSNNLFGTDGRWFPYCIRLANFRCNKISKHIYSVWYASNRYNLTKWTETVWGDSIAVYDVVKWFKPYLKATMSLKYMKFLDVFSDGDAYCYRDIYNKVIAPTGVPYGYLTDLFKMLNNDFLVVFDHKDKNTKYYKITDYGREVLRIAKENNKAHRVLRHFIKSHGDDGKAYESLIDSSLGNIDGIIDNDPATVNIALDAILCKDSSLREIGSYYFWGNSLCKAMKQSNAFYGLVHENEVMQHIDEMSKTEPSYKAFKAFIEKLDKKIAKKQATA